jgi:hypothetical protein
VFELSLNKSHNAGQAFPHYDKKPTEINFFSKALGLMRTAAISAGGQGQGEILNR